MLVSKELTLSGNICLSRNNSKGILMCQLRKRQNVSGNGTDRKKLTENMLHSSSNLPF